MSSGFSDLNTHSSSTESPEIIYSRDISMRMQVPDKITVMDQVESPHNRPINSSTSGNSFVDTYRKMEMPEKIVLRVGEKGTEMSKGDNVPLFTQPQSPEPLPMKAPPRVLTVENDPDPISVPYQRVVDEFTKKHLLDEKQKQSNEEVDSLKRHVISLTNKVLSLEEYQQKIFKINICLLGISLALSLINGISFLRKR